MTKRVIRIVLNEDMFRKYKVYCSMENVSMTEQTNIIVRKFVEDTEKMVKIIRLDKSDIK